MASAATTLTMKMRSVRRSQRRCVRGQVGVKGRKTLEKEEKMKSNTRAGKLVVRALAEAQKQEEDIDVDLVWKCVCVCVCV